MPTEPSAARAGRMPRFERRVLLGSLVVATPALLASLALVWMPWDASLRWTCIAIAVVATLLLARWQYRRVVFPLYTLSGLLEALRQGDYSLRGAQGSVTALRGLREKVQPILKKAIREVLGGGVKFETVPEERGADLVVRLVFSRL